ncbi:MAG TPA: lytic transglycosylase domain-containing protein [Niabella sp.]|jgi:membrane-bound lytic murein transglycosylase D|nr:lytic transglycosylase domain-containing protein [Niabella sp.]HUN02862.1 lytic transglycosylase domain-containing protein [Niabella sp.]
MTKINKSILPIIILLLFSTSAFAQLDPVKYEDALTDKPETPLTKTEIAVKADPKQSFKSLFEEAAASKTKSFKDVNTEHLNPMAASFVDDYMKRHSKTLNSLKIWAKPYFDMMDDVLSENGIPKQLKYLAVIESHLKASAVSWAGAVGPWQFMPETGRRMGLQVNKFNDERRDYLKSTYAASKYLNHLYDQYRDWLLVVAAYNCGPGRVNSAITRSGSKNFWDLQYYLPAESRMHVKKFIATHYIMEGEGGVATATPLTKEQEMEMMPTATDELTHQNVKLHTISGRYNSKTVAKYLEMDMAEFNKLNPNMDRILAASSTYQLKIPLNKVALFLSKKNQMLNDSIMMILNPDYQN